MAVAKTKARADPFLRLTQGSLKLAHVVIGLRFGYDDLDTIIIEILGNLRVLHCILGSVQP